MKPNFNKSIFWDVDYNSIDFDQNTRFVIARVLMRGDIEDWFELRNYYGLDKIKEEVIKIRYLDKLTLNFCHKLFNIEKDKFRCYNIDQSMQELWNY